jgi:NAD+ kinase
MGRMSDTDWNSFVEDRLRESKAFDADGLLREHPDFVGKLKYWSRDMCLRRPHTFDFIITVRGSRIPTRRCFY